MVEVAALELAGTVVGSAAHDAWKPILSSPDDIDGDVVLLQLLCNAHKILLQGKEASIF